VCNHGPTVAKSVPSIYRLTKVPDSELAAASIKLLPLENGLTLERIVGVDGVEISSGLKQGTSRCLLQNDGQCVPTPLAQTSYFADNECSEVGYYLSPAPAVGTVVYGLTTGVDGAQKVYELKAADGMFYEKEEYKMVLENGRPVLVRTLLGCAALEANQASLAGFFRRNTDVSSKVTTLGRTQLGSSRLRPEWFSSVVSGSKVTVLVRQVSERTIATSDGKVCELALSGQAATTCLAAENTLISLSEVQL
jgi:hypothetical protein